MPRIIVDAYRQSARRSSPRWASTDRGWLYDQQHPHRAAYRLPIGNYLDYAPCGPHYAVQPEGAVHAVVTPWSVDPVTGCHFTYQRESRWCRTVQEAQAWITERYLNTEPAGPVPPAEPEVRASRGGAHE